MVNDADDVPVSLLHDDLNLERDDGYVTCRVAVDDEVGSVVCAGAGRAWAWCEVMYRDEGWLGLCPMRLLRVDLAGIPGSGAALWHARARDLGRRRTRRGDRRRLTPRSPR